MTNSRCASWPRPSQGKKPPKPKSVYSDTVNLPQTPFQLRANSVKREPEIQAFWDENGVYERLRSREGVESFTLHDGPPYANGDLHIGHALNKVCGRKRSVASASPAPLRLRWPI